MTLEEDIAGEEVILGAPGLEFFGGERGFVGGGEVSLAPLNQGELDERGCEPGGLGADGFEGMLGLRKLLRGLLLEGSSGHEESEGGAVGGGGIGSDGLLPFGAGFVIVAGAPGEEAELFMGAGEAGVGCYRSVEAGLGGDDVVGTYIE